MSYFIKKAIKHPGAFTAQAKARGETPMELAANVKANPDKYDVTTKRRAALARTLRSFH